MNVIPSDEQATSDLVEIYLRRSKVRHFIAVSIFAAFMGLAFMLEYYRSFVPIYDIKVVQLPDRVYAPGEQVTYNYSAKLKKECHNRLTLRLLINSETKEIYPVSAVLGAWSDKPTPGYIDDVGQFVIPMQNRQGQPLSGFFDYMVYIHAECWPLNHEDTYLVEGGQIEVQPRNRS